MKAKKIRLGDVFLLVGISTVIILIMMVIASIPWVAKDLTIDGRIIKVVPVGSNFNVTFDTGHGVCVVKMHESSLSKIDGYTGRLYLCLFVFSDSLLYHSDGVYHIRSLVRLDGFGG